MHPPAGKPARARDGEGGRADGGRVTARRRLLPRCALGHCTGQPPRTHDPERGAAVVDFVMVGALATVFFLAIVQLALVLHVRNTLIDAAGSGARYGTLADRGAGDARERTAQLIGVALTSDFARDVSTGEASYGGIRTLEVTVRAPLPVIGLIGPTGMLEVKGHAAFQP